MYTAVEFMRWHAGTDDIWRYSINSLFLAHHSHIEWGIQTNSDTDTAVRTQQGGACKVVPSHVVGSHFLYESANGRTNDHGGEFRLWRRKVCSNKFSRAKGLLFSLADLHLFCRQSNDGTVNQNHVDPLNRCTLLNERGKMVEAASGDVLTVWMARV